VFPFLVLLATAICLGFRLVRTMNVPRPVGDEPLLEPPKSGCIKLFPRSPCLHADPSSFCLNTWERSREPIP
jgi:hypothetical protein